MKKKNYITPETNVILVKMEGLLAGSGEPNYGDPTVTPPIDDEDDI